MIQTLNQNLTVSKVRIAAVYGITYSTAMPGSL